MNDIGHNSGTEALQRIANDLNSEIGDDVESIFRKGRKFLDYKKQLGHGQFLRLFANHRDPLPEPVRCHHQTARRYMSVSANEELSKSTSMLNLPSDVTLLYDLSRIDEPGLKVAFKEGWITPYIKKKDIKEIRIRLGLDDEKAPNDPTDSASNFLISARKKARKILDDLPKDRCRGFLFELECMAKELQTEIDLTTGKVTAAE